MRPSTFAIALALLIPAIADASPWTLPKDHFAFIGGFDYGVANREYFQEGGDRVFPLRGSYTASSFSIGARYGVTSRLEIEAYLPLKLVSYDSDPVILLPSPSEGQNLDYYQDNIIDLTQTARGLGDLALSARYRWFLEPIAVATELRLKAPTGYDRPAGTFGERPASRDEFVADVGRFVRPQNIQDDVTLGDGQLDLAASVLLGTIFSTNTFVRLDLGYNLRTGGAGDQLLGSARVGQLVSSRLLVYAALGGRYTIQQGRVIGVSVAAEDPNLPAAEYGGLTNLLLREVRLERDELEAGAGFIVRVVPGVELNFGYRRTLWGRNTARIDAFSTNIALSSSLDES